MIYGRTGDVITIIRRAVLADVQKLDGRKPDTNDRAAIRHGSYVIVRTADGKERLLSLMLLESRRRLARDHRCHHRHRDGKEDTMTTITTVVFLPSAGCDAQITGRVHPEKGTYIDSVRLDDADGPCDSCGHYVWGPEIPASELPDGDQETAVDALETETLRLTMYKQEGSDLE